jgi:hypothetical protein
MRPYTVTAALAMVVACCVAARAEEPEVGAARQVFEKHQNTVVWVTAVMKLRAGGALGGMFGRQEQKVDAVGTVIHESGLTVLSYTQLDPTAMLNAAMAGAGAGAGVGDEKIEFKSELSGVKIRLADGTEVAARLVLKDDDLDLAFVMPTEKGKKLPYLNLAPGGDAPKVKMLDPVIGLWRLPQALDRQPAVAVGRIAAVVSKPRTFYVCNGVDEVGSPAFLVDGTPLGITVFRKQSAETAMRGMFSMSGGGGTLPVVVPATDVMEVAQQALAKKDEPAAAEPAGAPDQPESAPGGPKSKAKPKS